jgi:hypothetical protein
MSAPIPHDAKDLAAKLEEWNGHDLGALAPILERYEALVEGVRTHQPTNALEAVDRVEGWGWLLSAGTKLISSLIHDSIVAEKSGDIARVIEINAMGRRFQAAAVALSSVKPVAALRARAAR